MSDLQAIQIAKLEKLREAWLPAVTFLFGEPAEQAEFGGFEVNQDIAKPEVVFTNKDQPYHYRLQIPARSFTNDVMLLADVIQEMVRGLYPVGFDTPKRNVLSEGVAVYGAVTAIKQVFGEETLESYLQALEEQAFAYYDAFNYAAIVMTADPQAIKKLRAVQPFLPQLSKADFEQAQVDVERKMKDILLFTFRE